MGKSSANLYTTGTKPPTWRQLTPFRIAAIYVILGALWILFSDSLLAEFVKDPATLTHVQTAKGWAYVLATGYLLYVLIKRYSSSIQRSEETLSAIIDNLANPVMVIDPRLQLIGVNRAGLERWGLTEKEMVPIPFRQLYERLQVRSLDGSVLPLEETAIVRALSGEAPVRQEIIVRRPNGEDAYISASASPVKDSKGRVQMAVAILHDVTELRRLERIREEFLTTAAHELKTPVTVIKGYSQWILSKEPADGRHKELQIIVRHVDRVQELVDEMLRATELRAGQLTLKKQKLDLTGLTREIVERMQKKTEKHRLLFTGDKVILDADSSQIDVVITNLIDNAIRYSPAGGDIVTSVMKSETDSAAVVCVRDYGLGIPAEKQADIFQPFFQVQPGLAAYGGMGLGLFISKQIVESHGGRLWFESEASRGSKFCFSLPFASDQEKEEK